jgi:hypothetical protein
VLFWTHALKRGEKTNGINGHVLIRAGSWNFRGCPGMCRAAEKVEPGKGVRGEPGTSFFFSLSLLLGKQRTSEGEALPVS